MYSFAFFDRHSVDPWNWFQAHFAHSFLELLLTTVGFFVGVWCIFLLLIIRTKFVFLRFFLFLFFYYWLLCGHYLIKYLIFLNNKIQTLFIFMPQTMGILILLLALLSLELSSPRRGSFCLWSKFSWGNFTSILQLCPIKLLSSCLS